MCPAVRRVIANKAAGEDLLPEINELRKENARLKESLDDLSGKSHPAIEHLASLEEATVLHGKYSSRIWRKWELTATWSEIFGYISPMRHPNEKHVAKVLGDSLFARSGYSGVYVSLDDQDSQGVAVQLRALGLVNTTHSKSVGGSMGLFWSLTAAREG